VSTIILKNNLTIAEKFRNPFPRKAMLDQGVTSSCFEDLACHFVFCNPVVGPIDSPLSFDLLEFFV
jgi:hypothetical protein